MDKENRINIERFIEDMLFLVQADLDTTSVTAIRHYLHHAEYEMAFEGLFIEIMTLEEIPQIDLIKTKEVARLLNLHEETVFERDFWKKFENRFPLPPSK